MKHAKKRNFKNNKWIVSSAAVVTLISGTNLTNVFADTTSANNADVTNVNDKDTATDTKTNTNNENTTDTSATTGTGTTVDSKDSSVVVGPKVAVDPTVMQKPTTNIAATAAVTSQQQQNFLASAGPMAQKVASQYGLYASVMIAQAICESGWGTSTLAQAPNYNLFGIKGDYNGAYVTLPTSEWSASQGWYTVNANFRKYPSYAESFGDNGDKLRNGISGAPEFYKGTWKENTSSYKDATAWLQGRYATAPTYAATLNNIIETYGLTKYDSNGSVTQPPTNNTGKRQVVTVKSNEAEVYNFSDSKGSMISANKAFEKSSAWQTDQTKTVNGVNYYRVSTNEWLKASDVTYSAN